MVRPLQQNSGEMEPVRRIAGPQDVSAMRLVRVHGARRGRRMLSEGKRGGTLAACGAKFVEKEKGKSASGLRP